MPYDPASSQVIEISLISFTCLQFGIFLINSLNSHKVSLFKFYRMMSLINSLVPLLPVVMYITILLTYKSSDKSEPPSLLPFFIEWTISVPLLLINTGKLIQFSSRQNTLLISLPIVMSLTGYASATVKSTDSMLLLFGISSILYISAILFMVVNYCKYKKQRRRDTNFPSQLRENNLTVFKAIFYTIASIWNGYPIIFLLWKTDTIPIAYVILGFASLDFVTKGICILTLLAYTLMIHKQNGFLVSAFKKIFKVHPITDTLPTLTDTINTANTANTAPTQDISEVINDIEKSHITYSKQFIARPLTQTLTNTAITTTGSAASVKSITNATTSVSTSDSYTPVYYK